MKAFEILRCNVADVGEILNIERMFIECPWSETDLTAALSDERYAFYKAVSGGKTVGYMGIERCLDEGSICNVAVEPEFRRSGVATALIEEVERRAINSGIKKLFLEVNEHNTGAIKLYDKCGFTELFRRKNYYGKDAAIVMTKQL